MVLIPVALTLLSSLAAASFGFRRVAAGGVFLALASIILLAGGPLPQFILHRLQSERPLLEPNFSNSPVIVVLGIGTIRWPNDDFVSNAALGFSRVQEAARLYRRCGTCEIVASGGEVQKTGLSEAAVMSRDLESLGVANVIREDQSRTTWGNAKFTRAKLGRDRPVIVVTSGFHSARAALYFRYFFKDVTSAPSDYVATDGWWPNARTLAFVDVALHEVLGELEFYVRGRLGRN